MLWVDIETVQPERRPEPDRDSSLKSIAFMAVFPPTQISTLRWSSPNVLAMRSSTAVRSKTSRNGSMHGFTRLPVVQSLGQNLGESRSISPVNPLSIVVHRSRNYLYISCWTNVILRPCPPVPSAPSGACGRPEWHDRSVRGGRRLTCRWTF
jgi:hypothetical protein